MMDAEITRAVEDYVGAGLPARRRGGAARRGRRPRRRRRARRSTRSRASAASTARARCGSRPTTPSARCCGRAASRRSARSPASRPTTTCTTRWCPARKLVEVLRQVYAIAAEQRPHHDERVPRRRRQPAPADRVRRARARACGSACTTPATRSSPRASPPGECSSGEHGIGLEKREAMPLIFSPDDLDAQARLRDAFDPDGPRQPAEGPARAAAGAASCSACPKARGSDESRSRPIDDAARTTGAPPRRRGRRRSGSAARTGRSAARRRPAPTSCTCAAPDGVVDLRPRRPHRDRRRGHDRAPSSTDVLGEHGQECAARSPRRPTPPSAACSPPACRATGACASGRCATGCSRCAS